MTHPRPARFIRRSNGSEAERQRPAGICEEAFALVAGQKLPKRTVEALRRMVPQRQVIAVREMVELDNLSGDFARALLAAMPAAGRSDDARGRQAHADCAGRLAKMERCLVQMQSDARQLRQKHEADLVYLTLVSSFVRTWISSEVVNAWLCSHHPRFAVHLKALVKDADFAILPARPMKLPYLPDASPVKSRNETQRTRRRSAQQSFKPAGANQRI
ncbi:plasmid partitioning protein RepB C-terminal domain-containing protein [Paraburkholderia sp. DHOC27]|uniref:plasmid partitioning protein RepB C-terminal domain-containing protein n=1 Tax=Paraburkholderia sp. DHOC27 TaxID=2303330 RepID=UPI000E3BF2FD|nr:hypothetical protein D0B32_27995 [Paraburkholderia sp. DHOC27]